MALPNEFALFGVPILGLFALAPLFAGLRLLRRPKQAAFVMAIFGAVSTVLSNYWLMFFGDFAIWTIAGTTLGYTLYKAALGVFLWYFMKSRSIWRPFVIAAVWTVYEYFKSVGFLAYPWGLTAYPMNEVLVLTQTARVFGIWLLSFQMASLQAVLGDWLGSYLGRHVSTRKVSLAGQVGGAALSQDGPDRPIDSRAPTVANARLQLAALAALFLLSVTWGVIRLSTDESADATIDTLMVQQNGDSWFTSDFPGTLRRAQDMTRRGIQAGSTVPDLVVWSETALRYPVLDARWYQTNPAGDPYEDFAEEIDTWFLTGSWYAEDLTGGIVYNSTFLFDPGYQLVDIYEKQHLVPFAEHIPFWHVDWWRGFFREVVGLGATWSVGTGYETLSMTLPSGARLDLGTPICFEDAFGYLNRALVLRGADLLANLTNNAWSRTDSAQTQHFVAARFRAIETGRTLVRSTNAGYTSVVDPWGRELDSMPMFEAGYLRTDVPIYRHALTPYTLWGDMLPFVLMGVLALVCFLDIDRRLVRGLSGRL